MEDNGQRMKPKSKVYRWNIYDEYIMAIMQNSVSGAITNMTKPSILAYLIYFTMFLMSLVLIQRPTFEIYAFTLFFITNFFYSILVVTDIKNYVFSIENVKQLSNLFSPLLIVCSIALNFVSSIFTFMTMNEIREKFGIFKNKSISVDDNKINAEMANIQIMELQESARNRLDIVEILFYVVIFTISVSLFTLFDKGNSFYYIMALVGFQKYVTLFKIILILGILIVSSFILHRLNNIKSNTFEPLKENYIIIFSVIVIWMSYYPISFFLKQFTSYMFNSTTITVLASILVLILLGALGKFIYDSVDIFKRNSKEANKALKDIGLVNIFIFVLLICFVFIIMLPSSYSEKIFKYLFPIASLALSIYLTVETYDMSTLSKKQLVK